MSKYSNFLNAHIISNPHLSDQELISIVRELEPELYGANYLDLSDPEYPDSLLRMIFDNGCGTYTPKLIEILAEKSISTVMVSSNHPNSVFHVYAVLATSEGLRILDPSLGQYVVGERGVYISSREELRGYIEDPSTNLHFPCEDRESFFLCHWGNESKTVPHGLVVPETI